MSVLFEGISEVVANKNSFECLADRIRECETMSARVGADLPSYSVVLSPTPRDRNTKYVAGHNHLDMTILLPSAAVSLGANGIVFSKPRALTLLIEMPCCSRKSLAE